MALRKINGVQTYFFLLSIFFLCFIIFVGGQNKKKIKTKIVMGPKKNVFFGGGVQKKFGGG